MTDLSFVIPCYNEEGNVKAIYEAIHHVFDSTGISIELVMVNDGSKDHTCEKLDELYKEHEADGDKLTVVHFSRNFGKEAAILCGLSHTSGEHICLIDADLQHNPKIALQMYQFLQEHQEYDCAAAYQEERNEGKFLSFCKRSFYDIINKLTGLPFKNGASDFRVFRRKVADAILSIKEYERFTKGIFSFVGFETYFMPYKAEERNSGTTKWSFIKLMKYAIQGITSYTTFPLFLSYLGGAAFLFIAVLMWILRLCLDIADISVSPAYAVIAIIFFVSSFQLLALGVIGTYLGAIFRQLKGRPIYIEKTVSERK